MFKKYFYNGKETRYSISDDGRIRNDETGRELKGTFKSCEYQKVSLMIEGKAKCYMVHRLVAEVFLPNPYNLPVVHHIDGNKLNNNVSNLEWATISENNKHRFTSSEKITDMPKVIETFDENWKEMEKFPGFMINNIGWICNKNTHIVLNQTNRNGYRRVRIDNKLYSVHRLVYETFVSPIPPRMVIDHINGIRDDNRVENLRCVSQSENMYNAQKNGHSGQHKVAQYDSEHNLIKTYPSFTVAAKEFGVTYCAISSAARRHGTSCGFYWEEIQEDQ